jgi:hypothetical protein
MSRVVLILVVLILVPLSAYAKGEGAEGVRATAQNRARRIIALIIISAREFFSRACDCCRDAATTVRVLSILPGDIIRGLASCINGGAWLISASVALSGTS